MAIIVSRLYTILPWTIIGTFSFILTIAIPFVFDSHTFCGKNVYFKRIWRKKWNFFYGCVLLTYQISESMWFRGSIGPKLSLRVKHLFHLEPWPCRNLSRDNDFISRATNPQIILTIFIQTISTIKLRTS